MAEETPQIILSQKINRRTPAGNATVSDFAPQQWPRREFHLICRNAGNKQTASDKLAGSIPGTFILDIFLGVLGLERSWCSPRRTSS